MSIDSIPVGASQRQVVTVGDPNTANSYQSVLPQNDGMNLASDSVAITGAVQLLYNPSNLFDRQRAAVGTTGIPAFNSEGTKLTYSAAVPAFTPVATATDFFQLLGSASKTVRLLRVSISGIATAAASVDIQLIKRSSANSGSTPVTATAIAHDSNDAGATAVVSTMTVSNPTLGTAVGPVRAGKLNLGAAGAAGTIVWDFTTRNGKGLVLRGTAQLLALNWNGAAVPAGTSLDIDIEWSEE